MTIWFRPGIWGLLTARTQLSLLAVGYRVDVIAKASATEVRDSRD